jgi:hypothetical protein
MALVLEYPARLIIYMAVILVVVILFWRFFSSVNICFFNCEQKPKACDVEPIVLQDPDDNIDSSDLDKYCYLCWERNNKGECKENSLCYVLNGNFDPTAKEISVPYSEYCKLLCSKTVTSLQFTYDGTLKRVMVEC